MVILYLFEGIAQATDIFPVAFLQSLIFILKAVGIFAIIYICYIIFNVIISWKKNKRLKIIEKRVGLIEGKLDYLIKNSGKGKKSSLVKKSEK
ncbi:MAG: hypothetical protein ABIF88_02380 [archaeon]